MPLVPRVSVCPLLACLALSRRGDHERRSEGVAWRGVAWGGGGRDLERGSAHGLTRRLTFNEFIMCR